MKPSFAKGFTFSEVVAAVAVVAITLAFAAPSIKDMIRSNRLASATNQFVSALNLARSEAVKRGIRVTLRKTSTNWEKGWQLFTDNPDVKGGYGIHDGADETLRIYAALPTNYILRGNSNVTNYITYLPSGDSNQPGSFALCDNSDGSGKPRNGSARLIIVNSVGRVRLGIDSDKNGIPEDDNKKDLISCDNP